jgi:putative hemolysin
MVEEDLKMVFEPIDIRKVVASKNERLAKQLPGFVYRWLSKILHIEEMNSFMKVNGHLRGLEFVNVVIDYLNIKFNVTGIENIPKENQNIFVSNHPLGGLDGVLLLKFLHENVGYTRTLSNDFLMNVTPLTHWFVPINKVGGQARGSIQTIEELYQSGHQVLIFPAGLCSRLIDGKVMDLEWQKHFIQKSVQYKLNVVPIFFGGKNSKNFYTIARLRKFFKIKFNIEMMYLVDEMYKHKNKTFDIHFGNPIPHTTFNHSKKPIEWAQIVKEKTYSLAKRETL